MTVALIAFVAVDFHFAYKRRWAGTQKVSHAAHIGTLIFILSF